MTAHQTLSDLRAGRLAGATSLDLRGADLAELPPEVFTLADTLEHLDLSNNRLAALPDDLPRLRRLRVLFASNNRFTTLPAALGRCASLDLVGFKSNAIEDVPEDALPATLRWLILTDNRVAAMPESLGRCPGMQKLMLAGNRLAALPSSIGDCTKLELLRIAANRFETAAAALPHTLLALPNLAWIAFAGNPFNAEAEARALREQPIADIAWSSLQLGERLGEGASGHIDAATWQPAGGPARAVAVKRFKGHVTSDGLPASEMAACIAAGTHANLVRVEGRLADHPHGVQGLVLQRIPADFRNLAGPPSLASCTRDVYADGLRFSAAQARTLAQGTADALAHLHARGLMHGDLYAHNILVDAECTPLLGDFGAASFLPRDDAERAEALRRLDRRALAHLVDEIARRRDDSSAPGEPRPAA